MRLIVLVAILAVAASASSIVTTDPNAWAAASTGVTTVSFDGMAPAGGFSYPGRNPTFGSVTLTSTPGSSYLAYVAPDYLDEWWPFYQVNGAGSLYSYMEGGALTIDFADPVNAFAMTFNTWDNLSITLSNGLGTQFTASNSSLFYGFVGSSPITSVTITGYDTAIGTLSYGSNRVAAVPEPATLLLLGSGIAGIAGFRRRKQA